MLSDCVKYVHVEDTNKSEFTVVQLFVLVPLSSLYANLDVFLCTFYNIFIACTGVSSFVTMFIFC